MLDKKFIFLLKKIATDKKFFKILKENKNKKIQWLKKWVQPLLKKNQKKIL